MSRFKTINLSRINLVVSDGDRTLWPDRLATVQGFGHLKQAWEDHQYAAFFSGAIGASKIVITTKIGGFKTEVPMLEHFYKVMVGNRMGTWTSMHDFVYDYIIKGNVIPASIALINRANEQHIPIVLATLGGSTGAGAAVDALRYQYHGVGLSALFTTIVANTDTYNEGRLTGNALLMRGPEDKARQTYDKLVRTGIEPETMRIAAVGDNEGDLGIFDMAHENGGIRIASPKAKPSILAIADEILPKIDKSDSSAVQAFSDCLRFAA